MTDSHSYYLEERHINSKDGKEGNRIYLNEEVQQQKC